MDQLFLHPFGVGWFKHSDPVLYSVHRRSFQCFAKFEFHLRGTRLTSEELCAGRSNESYDTICCLGYGTNNILVHYDCDCFRRKQIFESENQITCERFWTSCDFHYNVLSQYSSNVQEIFRADAFCSRFFSIISGSPIPRPIGRDTAQNEAPLQSSSCLTDGTFLHGPEHQRPSCQ